MKFHILSLEKVCFTKCLRKHLDFFRFFLYNVYQQKERSDTVKANIIIRSLSAAALMAAIAGTSCGCALENMGSVDNAVSATASSSQTTAPVTETTPHTTTAPPEPLAPDDVIPAAVQSPRIEGSRLSYSIMNVYSEGDYYTVEISCIKLVETTEATELETTYINGALYGDFRLDLLKQGEIIDTLKINVPRDDRFLIFESVLQNLTYGCELISNMRDFSAKEYPDLIQLDFHMINEAEVPQYARYFAVSGAKLTEVAVYENGKEVAPYGTHLEPESAGLMIQRIVAKEYGEYTVKQYEYTFDPETLTITRKRVRYTGYN